LRTKQKVGTFTKIYKLQCNGYVNDYVDIWTLITGLLEMFLFHNIITVHDWDT
jgi:hypothetical protein